MGKVRSRISRQTRADGGRRLPAELRDAAGSGDSRRDMLSAFSERAQEVVPAADGEQETAAARTEARNALHAPRRSGPGPIGSAEAGASGSHSDGPDRHQGPRSRAGAAFRPIGSHASC